MQRTKYRKGDKVECNGNKEAVVIGYYDNDMVEVRVWNGSRHVGDVVVDEEELRLITND